MAKYYRNICIEHIDFVSDRLDYLISIEKDDFINDILVRLKDYFDVNFKKTTQDYLNDTKRLILTVAKGNYGTPIGEAVWKVYLKLKANAISPDDAMEEVNAILDDSKN